MPDSSATVSRQATITKVTGIAPYLMVGNVGVSVAYYRDVLGFTVDMFDYGFALVSRDGVTIMFQNGHGQCYKYGPFAAYIWVSDIDAFHDEFRAKGVSFTCEIIDMPWGTREFQVEDLDGYQLRFGQIVGMDR